MEPQVILVNEKNQQIGTEEKIKAHKEGLLHKAFSIFLVDGEGNTLIQKRAEGKYHSGGVWSNSCCSHQYPGESMFDSAARCLKDELGIDAVIDWNSLMETGFFKYYADLGEMKEHEMDHVWVIYLGKDVTVTPNPEEVSEVRWMSCQEIDKELEEGVNYSAWFEKAFDFARMFISYRR